MSTEVGSDTTGITYPSWEALVEAEANGWVVVAILKSEKGSAERYTTFARVYGPFDTQAEARNYRNKVRRAFKEMLADYPTSLVVTSVEPAWKEVHG